MPSYRSRHKRIKPMRTMITQWTFNHLDWGGIFERWGGLLLYREYLDLNCMRNILAEYSLRGNIISYKHILISPKMSEINTDSRYDHYQTTADVMRIVHFSRPIEKPL